MGYRPKYHLTAPQGRVSDPCGIALMGETLHVFFQLDPSFPREPQRDGWGHTATRLGSGTWRHLPPALYPEDAPGASLGSVVAREGQVRLFYSCEGTGQHVLDATAVDGPMGGIYQRREDDPVIEAPAEGIARNPHVSRGADGQWRMVVGAQRANHTGAVVLYTSTDLQRWELAGEIEFDGLNYNTASAHMWERPNLVRMSDLATGEILDVLVFCPRFPDSDECGYVVGRLEGTRFEVTRDFTPLDYGHEFFAPHLIPYGGGALAIAWMGLPGRDAVPSLESEGWAHSLTLVRELSLIDGSVTTSLIIPTEPDMVVERVVLGGAEFNAELVDAAGNVGATVHWQPDFAGRGTLSLSVDGLVRWAECAEGELVFVADGCAVELTAGGGEVAFSSAVFAPGGNDWAELRF